MKKLQFPQKHNHAKKAVATVSAAALMLGISHAATVAMHFQVNYCGYAGYTGFPVTVAAFGVAPSGWQNLTQMMSGYGSGACGFTAPPYGYTLNETVSTNTSTGGLNPLPSGTINITWSANTANFSDFGGYIDATNSPAYNIRTIFPSAFLAGGGEEQVYASFLRDGVNFGPPGGADNTGGFGGYNVDITGVHSVFTNTPFVVELIASSDSMQVLTNAFIVDVTHTVTNSVTYPNTPPVLSDAGSAPWLRGHGGGLSTMSGTIALNADHLHIMSAQAAHGGTGGPPTGYDNAGTISGFIITDQPVVTMFPQPVLGNPGDSVTLSAYAIGVPPLSYQWRKNGTPILGATNTSYGISGLNVAKSGNYDLVVTNVYGSATSKVAAVTVDMIKLTSTSQLVPDTNPANPERDGIDNGATWLASSSDGTITRSGVMQFVGTNTNSITIVGSTNFDSAKGTMMFWMRSAGIDPNTAGSVGAAILGRPGSVLVNDLILVQQDGGNLLFNAPTTATTINSVKNVSDNNWHLVVLTYDQSGSGGAALYIDGVLDTTNGNSSAWSSPVGQEWEIGFSSAGTLRGYNGLVDDVRFYNRELTAAEVTSIFNTGALVDTSALQMQLNFNTAPEPGIIMNWQAGNSVLQSAPSAAGPYTDVSAASSPYYVAPSAARKFYRYRFPNAPQSLVSNPYLM
jgi:hypothetical protein